MKRTVNHMNIPGCRRTIVSCLILLAIVAEGVLYAAPCMALFSIEDEKQLGSEFYKKLTDANLLVQDRTVNRYIGEIGDIILDQSGPSPFPFTFSVVNNSGINAFATPGGYVYVYSGLIKSAQNECQLAGVLAHEIAHIKARHIAKLIDKQTKLGIAALAGVLAGAFLGGSGEGGAAIATFSMATAASLSLKYSRENEEEADLMGMQYVVKAGYDGRGMLDFLKIMRQYEFYSNMVPSYFLTHPGASDRIRYLDGLLETAYRHTSGRDAILTRFLRVKTILIVADDNSDFQMKYFKERLLQNPGDVEGFYGLALVNQKLGAMNEAFVNFDRALALAPDDPDILRDLGITRFNTGRTDEAIRNLERAHALDRNDALATLNLGKAQSAAGDYPAALALFNEYLQKNPDDPFIYYNLAMTYGTMGNAAESHYHFGLYFKKLHKPKSALFHFKAALDILPPGSAEASRVQTEIDSLNQ